MNVECNQDVRDEIETAFKFNDAVIRSLIVKRDEAVTDMSALAKAKSEEDAADKRAASRPAPVAKEPAPVAKEEVAAKKISACRVGDRDGSEF
jgi:small subunit ribosomal protein S6